MIASCEENHSLSLKNWEFFSFSLTKGGNIVVSNLICCFYRWLSCHKFFFSVSIVSFCVLSKYSFVWALWKHRWSQKGLLHGLSNVLKVKSSAQCVCVLRCPLAGQINQISVIPRWLQAEQGRLASLPLCSLIFDSPTFSVLLWEFMPLQSGHGNFHNPPRMHAGITMYLFFCQEVLNQQPWEGRDFIHLFMLR